MTIATDRPAYRILATAGFFGPDDNLYPEGSEIYYDDEPNEEMEPLNELAADRLNKYLEKLDKLAEETAKKAGRPFVGRPRNLDGSLLMATEVQKTEMSLMGAKKTNVSIDKVEKGEAPETGKRGRGRPRLAV